jgi:AcrR family transcriptional regulator
LTQAQRREQTRARLLDAAKELFSEHGYHRTQVMDIVTRARVSAGTFYRYFDHKAGMFFAIADELRDHEVEAARKAGAMVHESTDFANATRNMVQFLERYFERVVERAPLYRALRNSGIVDIRRDHAWDIRESAVKAFTERLHNSNTKDVEDLESLARMISGSIAELRYSMMQTGRPTPAQAARLVTRFVQGGIAAYTTGNPRYARLFSDEWREALEPEAQT